MRETIGGKTFSTPEELGRTPPTEEELARAVECLTNIRSE